MKLFPEPVIPKTPKVKEMQDEPHEIYLAVDNGVFYQNLPGRPFSTFQHNIEKERVEGKILGK